MVNSVVARATSDMLIGPDWAMNIEICDMLNHDPGQARDVVKGIKKRLGSKNAKVQLLALTLLETIIKNCGDIVHMHVAEKGLLHEMVKMVKKKPDFRVKEKILTLIDTWQEAFGGARARYPQYYAAYHELLRAGAVFPQRSESSGPVFTPPQTQPLSSFPPNLRNPDRNQQDDAETSTESEFPTLSLTEIQNARGIMDVLSEMVNALEPGNKEAIRQEVIVDLVEQCRTYKQRVVHLVNSTADESLLCQGLALNDDLQRLLARHESISSGKPVAQNPKSVSATAHVDGDRPLIDTGDNNKQPETKAASNAGEGTQILNQGLLPAPASTNGPAPPGRVEPSVDLLSGDFNSPKAETSLALVPVGEQQPNNPPASDQNALVLFDMFSDGNNASNPANPPPISPGGQSPHPHASQFQQQQQQQQQQQPNVHSPQAGFYPNGNVTNMGSPNYEQSMYMQGPGSPWNGPIPQQQQQQLQQPPSPGYGSQTTGALPPPPWEAQSPDGGSPVSGSHYSQPMQVTTQVIVSHGLGGHPQGPQSMGNEVVGIGMYIQSMTSGQMSNVNSHVNPSHQLLHPQQIPGMQNMVMAMPPQLPQANQMTQPYYPQQQMYGNHNNQYNNPGYGYGHGQSQVPQYLEQQMYGLSVGDDMSMSSSSSQTSALSYVPPMKPVTKPEDKLFGDLVDIAKFKPATSAPGRAGSM
ncbi:TOM1-like protein 9 [Cucurbita moschata]|uniref:TOM1-like protein 9 n=1 Tax=Cucurbita moschata TaxID=3662 RepID=A0A6J1HCD1_CUCMO|nr:TOM1-like protein 9 [Cucurbita moschata]